MQQAHSQGNEYFAKLQAVYQAEWRCFSVKVNRWQSLKEEVQLDNVTVCEAEADARTAEERYRRARNALADYMLEHSCHESLLVSA